MSKELEVLETFIKEQKSKIDELSHQLLVLSTKYRVLENEFEEQNKIPVPPTVKKKLIEQESKIRKLEDDLKFYKNHVNPQIIINRENKAKPTRNGGIPKK